MKKNMRLVFSIAFALILAVICLWQVPSEVNAVQMTLPSLPNTMYQGNIQSFYAQVNIQANERLAINYLRLNITGQTNVYAKFDVNGNIINQSGHIVNITRISSPYYSTGTRYGYGYGYGPTLGYGYVEYYCGSGYGYGYGPGSAQTTQLRYLVVLNTSGMNLGAHQAQLVANVTCGGFEPEDFNEDVVPPVDSFLSAVYPFSIMAFPTGGGGGGGQLPTKKLPLPTDLNPYLDSNGNTTQDLILTTPDGAITIIIPAGTQMLDADGNPIGTIKVIVLHTPPPPPGYTLVGPAYECVPDGATFDPPLAFVFQYDPANIPEGGSELNLIIGWWDGSEWHMLPTAINTVMNTVTAQVPHFTPFAILGKLPPEAAAFTVSNLDISPAEANIGDTVTVTTLVTNKGDLSGEYKLSLDINGITVTSSTVSLDGKASEEITFNSKRYTAGTYIVNVNGLSGEFTVKSAAAFTVGELIITPTQVEPGENVTIEAPVTNIGQTSGDYSFNVKINGVLETTGTATVPAGESTMVNFTVSRDAAGTYEVNIDSQTGSFTVTVEPLLAWWIWLIIGIIVLTIAIALSMAVTRRN